MPRTPSKGEAKLFREIKKEIALIYVEQILMIATLMKFWRVLQHAFCGIDCSSFFVGN